MVAVLLVRGERSKLSGDGVLTAVVTTRQLRSERGGMAFSHFLPQRYGELYERSPTLIGSNLGQAQHRSLEPIKDTGHDESRSCQRRLQKAIKSIGLHNTGLQISIQTVLL